MIINLYFIASTVPIFLRGEVTWTLVAHICQIFASAFAFIWLMCFIARDSKGLFQRMMMDGYAKYFKKKVCRSVTRWDKWILQQSAIVFLFNRPSRFHKAAGAFRCTILKKTYAGWRNLTIFWKPSVPTK